MLSDAEKFCFRRNGNGELDPESSDIYLVRGKAKQFRDELIQRMSSGEQNLNLAMAMVSAVQSNVDETISWLEKAQRKYEYTFGYMVNIEPAFKPLYEEPGFIEIRKRMQYSF